ncbi:hypothetical protein A9199_13535 [Donghicola sp. JL3646]|nr:hypothetical protein BSK21_13245 [Marivivens sp. JLT3646]OBR38675.1 hypothetical protein A9199_13535 [Donghicola sp. JL3646]
MLLASVALTAFAGAAAAEVSFSGSATVGNLNGYTAGSSDTTTDGMYWDADLGVSMSQELDNGITAAASFTILIADGNNGNTDLDTDEDFVLSLSSDMGSLSFGDVEFAAVSAWKSAGDMATDGFREVDDESVLKGEVSFGSVTAAVAYVADSTVTTDSLTDLSAAVTADLGAATAVVAFQEETADQDEMFGISVATSLSGVDLTVAYSSNNTTDKDSTGIKAVYTIDAVKLTGFYVAESDQEDGYGLTVDYTAGALKAQAFFANVNDLDETRLQGSYDLGNGLVLTAGTIDGDSNTDGDFANYIVAEYDLGGGASLMASYADLNNDGATAYNDIDTFGGYELNAGTTLEVSFAF